MCAPRRRGPADRLGIAPAFVADGDAECQRAGLENAPLRAGRVDACPRKDRAGPCPESRRWFRLDRSPKPWPTVADPRCVRCPERLPHLPSRPQRQQRRPRALEKLRVRRRYPFPQSPVSGDEALGEADEIRAFCGGFTYSLSGQRHGLFWRGRKAGYLQAQFERYSCVAACTRTNDNHVRVSPHRTILTFRNRASQAQTQALRLERHGRAFPDLPIWPEQIR